MTVVQKKRRRHRRRDAAVLVSEIEVVEILTPKLNVYGHMPIIDVLVDGSFLAGCSCGWKSRNRARTNDGIDAWWRHARKINNGYLLMNETHEASEG